MDVTSKGLFLNRRKLLQYTAAYGLLQSIPIDKAEASLNLDLSDESHVKNYNNFYEFSTNKKAVAHLAKSLTLKPWSLKIYSNKKLLNTLSIDDLKSLPHYKRTYRLRCVEGWSAVIPWIGVQLSDLINWVAKENKRKFVRFEALHRPSEMLGQRTFNFPWPYVEGLRMDEAMNPLTMLAFGMYDGPLAPQCGAPVRLVVPWKYGFKSIKALTTIVLTDTQPVSSWSQISPNEYGFYANVNPNVPHPRWSQRRELRLGEIKKVRTLPFNGYAEEVADLYQGMDLKVNY